MAAKSTKIFEIWHNFMGHEYPNVAQELVFETAKVDTFVLFYCLVWHEGTLHKGKS